MAEYLLLVTFEPGVADTPMHEWQTEEITAHLDYYRALNAQLVESGELVDVMILTAPDAARIVRSDGTAPVVTDGPFQEFKEWVAGSQVVDVDTEERALEIAGLVSAAPGPGGIPLRQPIHVRRVMDDGPSDAAEIEAWMEGAVQESLLAAHRTPRRDGIPTVPWPGSSPPRPAASSTNSAARPPVVVANTTG